MLRGLLVLPRRQSLLAPLVLRGDVMPSFVVTWVIDIEADSHEAAAQKARDAQTRPDTTAVCFEIKNSKTGNTQLIDLQELT